jgi:hypothetical protein
LVALHGSIAGYRRLDEISGNLGLAALTLEDISLLDPASPEFDALYSSVAQSPRLAPGPAWLEFEESIVYRWTGASVSAELGLEVSAAELLQLWETERDLLPGSRPALLVSVEGRRFTLRFHPKHGPQREFGEIKKAFEIAFHRRTDSRNCALKWID